MSNLEKLKTLLAEFGEEVYQSKQSISVKSLTCIDKKVPSSPGVYWIETTMPVDEILTGISVVTGKNKKTRKCPPRGIELIEQIGEQPYIVYSGTEKDINKRLKQHLFNTGHIDTAKLSCVIDSLPFREYEWKVGFKCIDSYELRYAVEAWWRLNKGWPKFCLK